MFEHLDVEAYDRDYSDRELVRRLLTYFAPYRRPNLAIVLSAALLSLVSAATPMALSASIQRLASASATDAAMAALVGVVLVLGLLVWLANYVRRRQMARVIGDVVLTLRRDAHAATLRHDLSFFDKIAAGRIVSRITSDTQDVGQMVTLVADLASQIVQMLILSVVLVRISPKLTLLILLWAPTVVLLALAWRRAARAVTRQGARAMAEVNATIFETIAGIGVAKNFRREATVYAEFDRMNQQSYRINVRRGFVLATVFPGLSVLAGLGTAIILYAGGLSAMSGAIALGAWFLFLQSLDSFWSPLMNLSAFWSQVQAGLSAIERVFALMDAESAVFQVGCEPVTRLRGEVRFEDVVLHYDGGDTVLPGLQLVIPAGSTVALVGHTGAGKSSVARLIARLYEFQSGRLLIDGRDIRSLDLAAYRRQLGIVPQVPFLFSGTLADNIRYARPDAPEEAIRELAAQIGDGEWLAALPDGLETDVGERGVRLSMGQRQLVALMRVLLQGPAIFIFDEATASIDPFTEWQIHEALRLVLRGRTAVIIAHRLSTVRAADQIVVMANGRILEAGTHRMLLRQGGLYAELYATYFQHQSPAYEVTDHAPREAPV